MMMIWGEVGLKKALKVGKIIILSTLGLLLAVTGGSWIYHTFKTAKEIEKTPPIGELVRVNEHDMHVYAEGNGDHHIVFMAGGGTSSPTLDFKPLWSSLLPKHRIIVVEKAGYGWSEVANVSREIDFILEETRSALALAGETPPYVLAPHSMSGLEAIRWAQKYPEEVEAIIGLDPAIPEVYDVLDIPPNIVQSLASFAARAGLLRLVPAVANSSAAIASGNLSAEDEETYRALFYRRTVTANMVEEAKQVVLNAEKVAKDPVPVETPMYFFISDGDEIGLSDWPSLLSDYTEQLRTGKYLHLDAGHYLHTYEPEHIAKEVDEFLDSLQKKITRIDI